MTIGERRSGGARGDPSANRPGDARPTGQVANEGTPGAALRGGTGSRGGNLDRQREPLPTRLDSLPELPATYGAALDRALRSLGIELGDAALAAIDGHVRLLLAWNASINLTAITDPEGVATLHVADSLAALPLLRDEPAGRLVDLGSGGGFPGLPLAAALPGLRVTLVDSTAKKARFLEAAVAATGLEDRVEVVAARAEALVARGPWDVVVARAVGSLDELVELALPILSTGGRLLAWKRGDIAAELAAGGRAARALGGEPPEVEPVPVPALAGHVIVSVRKARPTPPGFPRDPAARRRRPW